MWLLAIAAVLNLTLWWLSYQNRGSEKIVTALVAALVGALTTSVAVIVFSGAPPISERFVTSLPVSFDGHTLRMVRFASIDRESPDAAHIFVKANEAIATLRTEDSSLFSMPYDQLGQTLLHHLLQRAVLERMAYAFSDGWQPESPDGTGTFIEAQDFSKYLRGNHFANLQVNLGGLRRLALPPKTKITIEPPTRMSSKSTIRIANPFCSISIDINPSASGTGFGPFARFGEPGEWLPSTVVEAPSAFDFRPVSATPGFVSYKISATASFSMSRSGHPRMPAYKLWVDELFASLREDWDDELIVKRTIERIRDEEVLSRLPPH